MVTNPNEPATTTTPNNQDDIEKTRQSSTEKVSATQYSTTQSIDSESELISIRPRTGTPLVYTPADDQDVFLRNDSKSNVPPIPILFPADEPTTWTKFSQCFCGCLTWIGIFCCPPCPCEIIRKLAFRPPPVTYHFKNKQSNELVRRARHKHKQERFEIVINPKSLQERGLKANYSESLKKASCYIIKTKKGNYIPVCYYPCEFPPARFTIIYSHPNAVDMGVTSLYLERESARLRSDICVYDYSGYGISSGSCRETNMYADIRAVFDFLLDHYKLSPAKIILLGQSLGTAATADLAATESDIAGVVLTAGFASAIRVSQSHRKNHTADQLMQKNKGFSECIDQFSTVEKVSLIKSPTLIMHGHQDDIIPVAHGYALYAKSHNKVEPLYLQDTNHNDISLRLKYWMRLQLFICNDLKTGPLYPEFTPTIRNAIEKRLRSGLQCSCKPSIHSKCIETSLCAECCRVLSHYEPLAERAPYKQALVFVEPIVLKPHRKAFFIVVNKANDLATEPAEVISKLFVEKEQHELEYAICKKQRLKAEKKLRLTQSAKDRNNSNMPPVTPKKSQFFSRTA